jgi:hypothetical protein
LNPKALRLLADENIHPEVISYLRSNGLDVRDIREAGMAGASDVEILRRALEGGRVVLTHDSDFGALAVAAGETIFPNSRRQPSPRSSIWTWTWSRRLFLFCIVPEGGYVFG